MLTITHATKVTVRTSGGGYPAIVEAALRECCDHYGAISDRALARYGIEDAELRGAMVALHRSHQVGRRA